MNLPAPDQPVAARLNLFPARVETTDLDGNPVTYDPSRCVVTSDSVYVWMDSKSRAAEPSLVFADRYEEVQGRNTTGWTLTLADGSFAHVRRSSGCGCGSRLRGFRPFPRLTQGKSL